MSRPHTPPQWISNFLRHLCRSEFHEEILGDLEEFYGLWVKTYGASKAKRLYFLHSIKFLRRYALKSILPTSKIPVFMFANHFKVAIRNLRKNRSYAFINMLGLTLGLASFLIINLWVHSELSRDHQHGDRVFSVYDREVFSGGMAAYRNTPAKLPAELEKAFPEIEYATGFAVSFRLSLAEVTAETFERGDKILKLKGSRGGPQFFNVFNFDIIEGSRDNALLDPSHVAISRRMANIFFGSPAEAMGQSIRYQNERDLIVSLVFEDIGNESSLQFDYLTHWDTWVDNDEFKSDWGHFGTQAYVKLRQDVDAQATEEKIREFLGNYIDYEDADIVDELGLQKFEDQYLYGEFENGQPTGGRIAFVRIWQGVGIFILLIAVFNFINLTTASASERIKEIGVRKVVGATRFDLRSQFLTESSLMTAISALVALLFVAASLPSFSQLAGSQLHVPWTDPLFWLSLLCFTILLGLLAGGYPSWILAQAKLIPALSKRNNDSRSSGYLRKGLVIMQFAISILLTVGTVVVSGQMNYLLTKSLGFNRENLIYIPIEGNLITNYALFREKAVGVPGVLKVDRSSQTPHNMGFSGSYLNWEGKEEGNNTAFTPNSVGFDFLETMKLEVIEGRDFDRSRPADENNFIVNEKTKEALGGDVLGKTLQLFGKEGQVIGVVKNYHFQSLHTPIKPLVLDVKEALNFGTVVVRLDRSRMTQALLGLEKVHHTVNPGLAFEYSFVDDQYAGMYGAEKTMSSLIPFFAGLAILISCLGLFGLVTLSVQQRVKEIGIRKVLGASVGHLLHLLSRHFTSLIAIAIVLSIPLSYWVMSMWLVDFAYRIDLAWWIFGLAALIAICISFVIVSIQVLKSALSNPVASLRSE